MNEPKRIMQTEFGPDGNCQSACLAMMLGIELEEVPNFTRLGKGVGFMCAKLQQEWLLARGLYIWTIVPHQGLPWPLPYGYYIAGGISQRGHRHAVIFKDGALWHDPHPDGGAIAEVEDLDLIQPTTFRPALHYAPLKVTDVMCDEANRSFWGPATKPEIYRERFRAAIAAALSVRGLS